MSYPINSSLGSRRAVHKRGKRGGLVVRFVTQAPRYPFAMWQLFSRLLNNEDTTNNYAESANNQCKQQFNIHHPTIWRFLKALHDVQRVQDFDFNRHRAGDRKTHRTTVEKRYDQIRNVMEEIDLYGPVEYLKSIAANLSSD